MPVIDMDNLNLFLDYTYERYKTHIRKDVTHESPITMDKTIRRHRFINVYRKHDTQTKYVLKYIINNDELSMEDKIVNILMFRGWGIYQTLRFFGGTWTIDQLMSPDIVSEAQKKYERVLRVSPKRRFFTSASYIAILKTAAPQYHSNAVISIFYMAQLAIKNKLPERILTAQTEQEVINLLKTLPGMADAISYQVFLDMTYIKGFPFTDENFVITSTRVRYSIRAIFKYSDGLNFEQCVVWLRDHIEELAPEKVQTIIDLMTDIPENSLTLTMLQSSLYGFSDYLKVRSSV